LRLIKIDREKLKLLINTLKQLIEEIESEVLSDTESYVQEYDYSITDYDEVFEDDDGYCD
jgi:hypothetical protein